MKKYSEESRIVDGREVMVKVYPPDDREDTGHQSRHHKYQLTNEYSRLAVGLDPNAKFKLFTYAKRRNSRRKPLSP